ncbi:uncharacterized protein LOC143249822 isoform X2 [Tachypleus tridentatus]|uniref:uncharacterized protein LOC143249822 isoform X2 n=1 Tax=Tachypleus tridentatus TaxID=6853 RepID=UPI003FD4ED9B
MGFKSGDLEGQRRTLMLWCLKKTVKVYREWVCATMLPFFIEDQLVKPCRSFCHRVEQQCPYFHPFYYEQYAGEPVFFCIDPSIPDIPSITPNSPYKQPGSCYESCHVSLDTNASSCNVSDLLETLGTNCTGETSNSSTQSIPSDAESNAANPCVVTSLLFIVIHVFWHPLVPRNCIRTNDKLAKRTKLENHVKEPT